ncbi:MAG: hypothetical protein LBS19_05865 [Clostridiales bacterium]|nr:hypothetical protein [Clostridiales bacterium]
MKQHETISVTAAPIVEESDVAVQAAANHTTGREEVLSGPETPQEAAESPPLPDSQPNGRSAKKSAKEREKAKQAEAYRKSLSAAIMQNASHLAAYGASITEQVPSAAEAVKNILAVFAASTAAKIGKL